MNRRLKAGYAGLFFEGAEKSAKMLPCIALGKAFNYMHLSLFPTH
jgi:hypothetical protein